MKHPAIEKLVVLASVTKCRNTSAPFCNLHKIYLKNLLVVGSSIFRNESGASDVNVIWHAIKNLKNVWKIF